MVDIEKLTQAAISDAHALRTYTRGDGSSFIGPKGHGIAVDGGFQVYAVPVTARTRPQKEHYRATYYLLRDGQWKRCNRAVFSKEASL